MKIKVVTHYCEDDPEFDCDYTSIDVFIDEKLHCTYGDYYHDKGDYVLAGFFQGLKYASERFGFEYDVEKENVADF